MRRARRVWITIVAVLGLAAPIGSAASTDSVAPQGVAGFQVSGTISAGPGTAVDSDVNDPNAPFAANDSLAQSQPIPAPSTLGGYLNSPGAGAVGRGFLGGGRGFGHGLAGLADVADDGA